MIGRNIASYQVVAKLGAGGMGEVYRAHDAKLNRDVAIKVLPAAFAADADRVSRFTREAQTLAALNHPNIAHIYDAGVAETKSGLVSDGSLAETKPDVVSAFLVMELVEGEDLSVHIARGPMAPAEVLPIARQLADALETAHEQGIIHRDLKPANIKVRQDGTVKVLDFGLAKVLTQDPGPGTQDLSNSPTLTARATEVGIVLGTAAYMSPEQAKGRPVDKRADIWAFGVVLHEMLTGKRLFHGESVAETLGLIFSREWDPGALPPGTPPGLKRLLARCLEKDPRRRLRDIGEARVQIDEAIAGREATSGATTVVTGATPEPRRLVWHFAAALLVVAAAAAAAAWFAKPAPALPAMRLSIALLPGQHVTTAPTISADGQTIAYAAGRTPASSQLYLRSLTDDTPRPVASSTGAQYPFFSPDARTIVFFAGGKLRRASTAGGAAADIASSPTPWGGTWDADGKIIFTTGLGSGLWRVGAEGGPPEQLTKPDGAAAGYAHVFPQRLPGTRDVLFGFWGQTFYAATLSLDTLKWREVTVPSRSLAGVSLFVPGGFLAGNDGAGNVVGARWTPASTSPVAPEAPIIEGVFWVLATERSWLSAADNGTAVYVPGNPTVRRLVWVNRRGEATAVPGETDAISQATLSHDGTRAVYGSLRSQWIIDFATGAKTRLIGDIRTWTGGWLPGEERLAFSSNKDGDWDLFTIRADGSDIKPLLRRPFAQHVQAIARDGTVVFLERHAATGNDLWRLSPDGQASPLVVTPSNEVGASISPDGRYVAYVSDAPGRDEVFAMPMTGKGDRVAVSINGGTGPVWSRDGRELFYRAGDDLMSVAVNTSGPLVLGERRRLLDLSPYDSGYFHEFDVSPDGQRFLLIRTEPESRPYRLNIITNWIEELARKVKGP